MYSPCHQLSNLSDREQKSSLVTTRDLFIHCFCMNVVEIIKDRSCLWNRSSYVLIQLKIDPRKGPKDPIKDPSKGRSFPQIVLERSLERSKGFELPLKKERYFSMIDTAKLKEDRLNLPFSLVG